MANITKPVILNETGVRIANALEAMAIQQNYNKDNWDGIQNIIDAGLAPKAFPVGTLFNVAKEKSVQAVGSGNISGATVDEDAFIQATDAETKTLEFVYDGAAWLLDDEPAVLNTYGVGYTGTPAEGDKIVVSETSEYLPFIVDESTEDGIGLILQYGYNDRPFDGIEAFWANDTEEPLPAGTYWVQFGASWGANVVKDEIFEFTLTQPVPVGGQLYGFERSPDVVQSSWRVSSYASATEYTAIETVVPQKVESSSGTFLGILQPAGDADHAAINSLHRSSYGSNHWGESNVRQWLGSDKPAGSWFTPKTKWDRLATQYRNLDGFMRHMDPGFLRILAPVENICAYNTVFNADGNKSGSYTTKDKFFLRSMTELGYGNNNGIAEGTPLPYWTSMDQIDRRVFDINNHATARHRFMRSAHPSHASSVRTVHSVTGALNSNTAYNGYCVAPACKIIRRK